MQHGPLARFSRINSPTWHCHTVFKLKILSSLELNLTSSSISKLLEILASHIIFLQQELHCHLQSLYFKPYLGVIHMFYNTFAQ